MKKARILILLFVLLLLTSACALGETRVMVVSDIHYLAPELYQGSELFLRALRAGDGKITQYSEELMAALEAEALHQMPDALIVTGDLTFNGEKVSHQALAQKFAKIQQVGVPVYVIPGNHDINCPDARAYGNGVWMPVETVTEAEFAEIYREQLLPAEGGVNANFSYHVEVSDDLWLALVDAAYYRGAAQVFGFFTGDHQDWLTDVLERADRAGARVVTASHHSLIAHTDFSRDSYVMFNDAVLTRLLKAHHVPLHLSGHLHVQHIAQDEGLYDAALGAFCVTPHRYALVTLNDDGALTYQALALCDEHLPSGFQDMSRDWFYSVTAEKNRANLSALDVPDDDLEAMIDFSARFNVAYFSGLYRSDDPAWREDPGYLIWREHRKDGVGAYLEMIMNEKNGDNLYLSIAP